MGQGNSTITLETRKIYALLREHAGWGNPEGGRVLTAHECASLIALVADAFKAGFDEGVRAVTPPEVLRKCRFTHPRYISDRQRHLENFTAALARLEKP